MSVFGKIMSAIFGSSSATAAPGTAAAASGGGGAAVATAPAVAPMSQVDVEAVLTQLAVAVEGEARSGASRSST